MSLEGVRVVYIRFLHQDPDKSTTRLLPLQTLVIDPPWVCWLQILFVEMFCLSSQCTYFSLHFSSMRLHHDHRQLMTLKKTANTCREEDKLRSKGRLRSHPRRNQQAYCGASQVSEKMKKLKSESEEHGRRRLKPWRRKSTSMPYVQRQSEELLLEYMTGCWRTTTHCKLRFFPSGAETELVRWLNRFDRNRN